MWIGGIGDKIRNSVGHLHSVTICWKNCFFFHSIQMHLGFVQFRWNVLLPLRYTRDSNYFCNSGLRIFWEWTIKEFCLWRYKKLGIKVNCWKILEIFFKSCKKHRFSCNICGIYWMDNSRIQSSWWTLDSCRGTVSSL